MELLGCSMLIIVHLINIIHNLAAQPEIADTAGREFVLGFIENEDLGFDSTPPIGELFITTKSRVPVSVSVSVPRAAAGVFTPVSVSVVSGAVKNITIPNKLHMKGTEKGNKGILIRSTKEIIVYAINKERYSTGAFIAYPLDVLGTEYYVIMYKYYGSVSSSGQKSVDVGIVAAYNSTSVNVTIGKPKSTVIASVSWAGRTYKSGDTISINLQAYQSLQLQSEDDLSGSLVMSDRPVAVFSGCMFTPISNRDYGDHMVEQMTPTKTWGKKYITVPVAQRTAGDIFRIMTSTDNTLVSIKTDQGSNFVSPFKLSRQGIKEIDVPSSRCLYITANNSIYVMQYSKSYRADNVRSDPFMLALPSTVQYVSSYTLATVNRDSVVFNNFINIIIPTKHKTGLLLNNAAIASSALQRNWVAIAQTGYSAATLSIGHGVHTLNHSTAGVNFGAFMMGNYIYEAYAYSGGQRLANVANCQKTIPTMTPGDQIDNDCDENIDEEVLNSVDDDGDGLVDEDLVYNPSANLVSTTNGPQTTEKISTADQTTTGLITTPSQSTATSTGMEEVITSDITFTAQGTTSSSSTISTHSPIEQIRSCPHVHNISDPNVIIGTTGIKQPISSDVTFQINNNDITVSCKASYAIKIKTVCKENSTALVVSSISCIPVSTNLVYTDYKYKPVRQRTWSPTEAKYAVPIGSVWIGLVAIYAVFILILDAEYVARFCRTCARMCRS